MLLDVVEEHLEEVEILWSRRRLEMTSPRTDVKGLAALEERMTAHLEGAVLGTDTIGGESAPADADRAFALAAVAILTDDSHSSRELRAILEGGSPAARQGAIEALCHLPLSPSMRETFEVACAGESEPLQSAATDILSFHRLSTASLMRGLRSRAATLRAASARAVGRMGAEVKSLEVLVHDDDSAVRDAACAAAALRGQRWAVSALRWLCSDPERVTSEAVRLLGCIGDASDIATLRQAARSSVLGEPAVTALGTLGFGECVEVLLECMEESHVARAAGAAYRRITGIGPEVRDADDSMEEIEFHDLRPMPDPEATRRRWRVEEARFTPTRRWRGGVALVTERWLENPHHGDLLTRREELIRIWSQEPDRFPGLELDAPMIRQRHVAA